MEMVFNATLSNISVISWRVLLVEETGVPGKKTTDLPQVTDKLYHIMLYRTSHEVNDILKQTNSHKNIQCTFSPEALTSWILIT
jgi:hypothetical protein